MMMIEEGNNIKGNNKYIKDKCVIVGNNMYIEGRKKK